MRKALFLDRDGIVNELVYRGENFYVKGKKVRWSAPFSRQEFVLRSRVGNFLEEAKKIGYLIILVSNQPDVAYGNLTLEEHNQIMAQITKFPFDDIYVCMHGRDEGCKFKKPKPGMIFDAAKKWNIDLKSSYFFGDSKDDLKAAAAAGCRPLILKGPYFAETPDEKLPEYTLVKNFDDVLKILK